MAAYSNHEDHFPCSFPTLTGTLEPLLQNTLDLIHHSCSGCPLLPVISGWLEPLTFVGDIVRRILCDVCWLTFQMPSSFFVPSEFITPVEGTNYDLRPAPVGLQSWDSAGVGEVEQFKGCWFLCHCGGAYLGKPLLTKGGILPLSALSPAVSSFSLHKCVLSCTFWTRCVALQVLSSTGLWVLAPFTAHHSTGTFPHS